MNVLLVSVDTTRADHLGCYGHPTIKTPNIDRLAAEGTRFAQCISSASTTLPSHASILTGSYPFVHGARANGTFVLKEENETLTERLAEEGYDTYAEVASEVLNRRYGIAQGFKSFGEVTQEDVAHADGVRDPDELERKASEITRRGIELLNEIKDRRFFLFLHYFDPHWPYEAPLEMASRFKDPYVAEIAYFDAEFGKLMTALRTLGLSDRTLVVLLSDHGEGRGDHGEQAHSFFVYDSTQHVPLILWSPGQVPAGQVVESQVRLIDVAPTILDFVQVAPSAQMQGESLLPLLAEPERNLSLACYGESVMAKLALGYSTLRFLRGDGWKYIHAPKPELYHVEVDPKELTNLIASEPERAAAMRRQLKHVMENSPAPPAGGAAVRKATDEELRRLQQLGYVTGDPAVAHGDGDGATSVLDVFEPQGRNPADHMELLELSAQATVYAGTGRRSEAEQIYRQMRAIQPDNPHIVKSLANVVAGQGRYDEAAALYAEAYELEPITEDQRPAIYERMSIASRRYADFFWKWGAVYALAGKPAEAVEKLEEACRLEPALHRARFLLAENLYKMGRREEAIEQLATVVEANPQDVLMIEGLARWCAEEGKLEMAERYYRRVIELAPDDAAPRVAFAKALLQAGKPKKAIVQLRRAKQLAPDNVSAALMLAKALAEESSQSDAARVLEELIQHHPRNAELYHVVAAQLAQLGAADRATAVLRRGHERMPDESSIVHDLAWRLATTDDETVRDGAEAARLIEPLVASGTEAANGDLQADLLDTLAAAYAADGRYEDAVSTARRAHALASRLGKSALAQRIAGRLAHYENREIDVGPAEGSEVDR